MQPDNVLVFYGWINITGQSAVVTRFYSTENMPNRYFRVSRN